MNAQDFRKIVEKAENKSSVLLSPENLKQCEFSVGELWDIIKDCLSDEEKYEICKSKVFQKYRVNIIGFIENKEMLLQIVNDENVVSGAEVLKIIPRLDNAGKRKILHNQEFIKKHRIGDSTYLSEIIASLDDETEVEVLTEDYKFLTEELKLGIYQIKQLTKRISNEALKNRVLKECPMNGYDMADIIKTFSYKGIVQKVLEEERIEEYRKDLLKELDFEALSDFFSENKEFCERKNLSPYQVTMKLDVEKQKEFVEKLLEKSGKFSLSQKKEILASLDDEVKQSIDTTNFPEEFKTAMSMQVKNGEIDVDFERDLEDYRGLDNFIKIYPVQFTEEQRCKLMKLCDICPKLEVFNIIKEYAFSSTGNEYKEAEEWITFVFDSFKPEYSRAQKAAVIDHAIGKKISYSPDFDTEVADWNESRKLWRIINSGYGVCNGIAEVEKYMYSRAGIESEVIASKNHAFLRLKDMELPLESGEIVKGDTITDPTWGLAANRFDSLPNTFCVTYKDIRNLDIDKEKKTTNVI